MHQKPARVSANLVPVFLVRNTTALFHHRNCVARAMLLVGVSVQETDQISSLSKSCYSDIRELRCIHPYLDSKTANTIAASIVHSKLDYCNSLCYNLQKSQINRLQQIQNCLARTVVKAPKSSLITPILRSLHWIKINERIEYKLLSLTYKVLTTSKPDYLHNLISVQSSGRTRSLFVVTLARPSVSSSLLIAFLQHDAYV